MKLLSKDLLFEYGFIRNSLKTTTSVEVMSKDDFDICIMYDGRMFYKEHNHEQQLKDIAALRKLYKEVKMIELKPIRKTDLQLKGKT